MSFTPLNTTKIILNMYDVEYPVISYNFNVTQSYNANSGDVVSDPVGELLYVSIISNGEDNFVAWMKDVNQEPQSGAIEFYSGGELLDSISFEDAFLVAYNQDMDEVVDASGQRQRVVSEDLSILWKSIEVFGIEFKKRYEED